MQTGKFTIFDYIKLQNPDLQESYQEIMKFAMKKSLQLSERQEKNYTHGLDKMALRLDMNYYIKRANEIINASKSEKTTYPKMKTANEKMLFITTFAFPDNQKFIDTLNFYGIEKKNCIHFSEEIKNLCFYPPATMADRLTQLIIEYFEELPLIKRHYNTNNTGLLINKILEIAYLHPELLKQKEKS